MIRDYESNIIFSSVRLSSYLSLCPYIGLPVRHATFS